HVLVEGHPVDPELVELLCEELCRHAVEEEVDGEDHDAERVGTAEDRNLIRHDLATADQVAGRPREKHLAAGRHPLVKCERENETSLDRSTAWQPQEETWSQ